MNIKTTFKKFFQNFALRSGLVVNRIPPNDDLEKFLDRFKEKYMSIDMVRIGGDDDGGYLIPNNLDSVNYCFSPGVDYTASFESELSKKYNIKSFMADASVSSSPVADDNLVFIKKFLGSKTGDDFITLSDWMKNSIVDDNQGKLLQMDIEGGEYDVLSYESSETLAKFSTMVIEFHGLQNMFDRHFLKFITAIFEKIYVNFSICHVHPNNCSGIASYNGIDIPRVIEVTFIRNDLVNLYNIDIPISLPHPLDQSNIQNISEIVMPEIWWKK
tara:strand:+ start:496 stop:1311 length:816 start_codon:yes stop_codon:yes gene_type:complete